MHPSSDIITHIQTQYPAIKLWKITKISKNDGGKIHPDYWVIGELQLDKYKIGGYIYLWRFANSDNPEGKLGEFTSSEIIDLVEDDKFDLVRTKNSTYRVEKLNN